MAKNYYAILGVLPNASPEDIRGAYRRRVKELHPDYYGDNSSPFLEVQEAYSVLSDPGDRNDYDRSQQKNQNRISITNLSGIESLRPGNSPIEPLRGTGAPADLGIIDLQSSFHTIRPSLEEIWDGLWSNFAPEASYKSDRLQNLQMEILLTPDEAHRGGSMEIMLPSQVYCPTCRGKGAVGPYQCFRCMGSGIVSGDIPVTVEFAPGISDGYQKAVSLRNLGIRDIYITLIFRISKSAEIEDL